jgi:hypothetical protein
MEYAGRNDNPGTGWKQITQKDKLETQIGENPGHASG